MTRATLFHGGPIVPGDGQRLAGGVLLTEGARIAYVGPSDGLDADRARGAERVDLAGRPLLPGFCDSHLHLVDAAMGLASLDLRDVADVADLQRRVRQQAATIPDGVWLVGHGWERRRLLADREPSLDVLDEVAPQNPVFLASKDLHSAWLNSTGLERLLTLRRLPGKSVIHRIDGQPTGLVLEDLFQLRTLLVPAPSDDQKLELVHAFVRYLWAHGITAVHSNERSCDLPVTVRLCASGGPRVRVLVNLVFDSVNDLRAGAGLFQHHIPGWLCTGGAKLFLDGAFGSLTAAVSHPYAGTDDRGLLNLDQAELGAWLEAIAAVGVPAVMHAIGDRALETGLDGLAAHRWPTGCRHRLEHAQLLNDRIVARDDLEGLVFSGQPSHMWADREIVERSLPDANGQRWAYAYRTLSDRGGLVVFGSDAPVETIDPWKGIQAAVTRLERGDVGPWIAAERVSLAEALAAHTSRPAQLHAHGFATGVLEAGRLADLVILNQDPFALAERDPAALRSEMCVDRTYLDGELVYERSAAD